MNFTRRQFLTATSSAAVAAAIPKPVFAANSIPTLTARPGVAQLVPPDYPETHIWSYEGSVPGPTIVVQQNARVTRKFVNQLPQESSIHWHGIRIENSMDGAADVTQPPVPANGGEFIYDFTVPDAGTYFYHPHVQTWEQMGRGLYGALIVQEPTPPLVDADDVLLIDDWRLTNEAQIHESFGAPHDASHDGRIGNWITTNGLFDVEFKAKRNERRRLRLINAANARIFELGLEGIDGWVVAIDGQPLTAPQEFNGTITLAPGQRVDIFADMTAEAGHVVSFERDAGYAIASYTIEDVGRDHTLPTPKPLPPNPVAKPTNLDKARKVELVMDGGAMSGMSGALMDGKFSDARTLARNGKFWAMNGSVDKPEEPFITASLGETVQIGLVNNTRFPHSMHLHGHHVWELDGNGTPGMLRDTVLVNAGERLELALVCDNPGDWLFHCHMLEHSPSGMLTWFRVV